MLFELLLGPSKKGVEVTPTSTAWCALPTLVTPASAAACAPPQSSAALVDDACWPEGGSRVSRCESVPADIALRLTPKTLHLITGKAQQPFSRGRLARSSSLALTSFAFWRRGTALS